MNKFPRNNKLNSVCMKQHKLSKLCYLILIGLFLIQYSIISTNSTIYTPEECEFLFDSSAIQNRNMIVADKSSGFVLTNFGRMHQSTLFFLEGDMTLSNTTYNLYVDQRPLCFSVQSPTLTSNETIHVHSLFGKKYALNGQYAAVGISNAYDQKYLGKYSYSSIAVIEYTADRISQFREYIEEFSSPLFGIVFDINSHCLASIVSNKEIKIYTPYINRTRSFWNSDQGDKDSSLPLPNNFFTEGIYLSENYLVVSGIQFNPISGNCSPHILIYEYSKLYDKFYLLYNEIVTRGFNGSVMNHYSCERIPDKKILLSISPDERFILISVPYWNTVFLAELNSFATSSRQFTPINVNNWGKSIGFTKNNSIFILSDKNVFIMSLESFLQGSQRAPSTSLVPVNPFQIGLVFPNRIQQGNGEVFFVDAAANNNVVVAVTQFNPSNPSLEIFPIPAPVPGSEYDYMTGTWKNCEPGRFKDTSNNFFPCKFCDVGTYQSETGATNVCLPCKEVNATYCPVGSSVPIRDKELNLIFEGTKNDVTNSIAMGQLPKFESEDFRETFEEILIVNLFYIYSIPMIIALIWTAVVWIFVAIASLFYCHYPTRNLLITIVNCMKYIKIPNLHSDHKNHKKEEYHDKCQSEEQHQRNYSLSTIKTELKRQIFGITTNNSYNESSSQIEQPDSKELNQVSFGDEIFFETPAPSILSDSKQSLEAKILQELIEEEEKTEVTRKKVDFHGILTGYFNSIFLLFSISALIVSISFILSYTPELPSKNTNKDINRYHSERLILRDSEDSDVLEIKAFHALIKSAFTIRTELIGHSGISCSWDEDVVGFQFQGCWIKDTNSLLPCNESNIVITNRTVYIHPILERTCVYEVNIPNNAVLSNSETKFMLLFKPNLHIQALRYTFYQQAVSSIGPNSLFEIGEYQYREVILNRISEENYMPSVFERTWIWTPVVYKYQYIDSILNAFKTKAFSTISCEDEPIFPTTTFMEYLNDQTESTKFIININLNSIILVRQSEQLIQSKAALLNVLLAIIGVYHVLHFMELLAEMVISFLGILSAIVRRPIKRRIRKIKAEREATKRVARLNRKLHERLETENLKKQLMLDRIENF